MFDRSIHSYGIPHRHQRIVAISDIHGNLAVFQKLLKKIAYDPENDELFLVGDLLEKGIQNLATLHYIMELSKHPHVHPMIGNCDVVCRFVLHDTRLDFLHRILMQRQNSIIHEMAQHIGITIRQDSDMKDICQRLRQVFLRELTFVDTLPHVIETDAFIFAHAGILQEQSFGNDMRDIMVQDMFFKQDLQFHKYVVVGHLPVSEYRSNICCFDPIIDRTKHIISIDGGNQVKAAGQLNALLYENGHIQFAHSDELKKARVIKDVLPANPSPFFITWHEGEVRRLKERSNDSYCQHIASKRCFWIPNAFLLKQGKQLLACDFTNYRMPLRKGEYVKVVSSYGNYSLVKRHALMGWCNSDALYDGKDAI